MGRKNKNALVKSKNNLKEQKETEEFQLNLKSLDGYDLPDSEEKEDDIQQPKSKKRKQSRPQVLGIDYREREEKRLEQLLFGELLQNFERDSQVIQSESKQSSTSDELGREGKQKVTNKQKKKKITSDEKETALPEDVYGNNLGLNCGVKRQAAWVDEDDDNLKLKDVVTKKRQDPCGVKSVSETAYKKVLEKNFAAVHGQVTPKWAQLGNNEEKKLKKNSDDEEESDDEDLTKTVTNLLTKDSVSLPQNIIKVSRMKDINKETRTEGAVIRSVEFHKKQNVALVAGNSGIVSLFQIGGSFNAKIQSISLKQFPVHQARFSADGEEFVASSNLTGNIQIYNLTSGKNRIIPHNRQMEKGFYKNFVISPDGKFIAFQGRFGYIHLMSARSKEWISSLKMNGEAHALTFNGDGTRLYSHGEFGEVYVWDMNTRTCVHKFVDDGCVTGTAIAVSSSQQYLACGSSSGVVNLYSTSKLENNSIPKPDKAILNLVTRISGINFHPSSELASMFSYDKENSVRLLHFPSMTVFKNFPDRLKGTSKICSMDFSPNGGYMAAGFNNGSALLYRLNHYEQY